jgi:F0F1-type ATP synthase membrane subunit c/vacuolar-type H+-ATPase subunit K
MQNRILWFAIACSTVLYAVVAYSISPAPNRTYEAAVKNPLVLVMYLAALSAFAAGNIVPAILKGAPARTRMILALAIFESCAIFGLVASLLLQDWRLYLGPWALAAIGFLRVWPSEEISELA